METTSSTMPIVTVVPEPLTEEGVVAAAIEFANKGNLKSWLSLQQHVQAPVDALDKSPLATELRGVIGAEREVLRTLLTKVVAGSMGQEIADTLADRASQLILRPKFKISKSRVYVAYRHHTVTHFEQPPASAVSYALLLLLDSSRSFGGNLCQCNLASCGRFFLSSKRKKGRPNRLYCKQEHMLEVHDANAPERVKRSRLMRKTTGKIVRKRR